MSAARLHLVINHLPLAALLLALVLRAVSSFWRGANLGKGTLVLFVVAALATVPTYFSGEPAEEEVEDLPGVSATTIEPHETAAGRAAAATAITGAAALLTLFLEARGSQAARRAGTVALLLALVSTGLMGLAAHLGGQIRHPELRPGAAAEADSQERH